MNQFNFIIGGIVALLLMGVGFLSGWSAHERFRPCPIVITDTIEIVDPYWHHIVDSLTGLPPNEVIHWLPQDTLFVPGDSIPMVVDTAAILKDYFSVYKYHWEKKDDTLAVDLYTTVTKNMPIKYDLSYKVLIPFTTVVNNTDNSITYSKYLYFGLDVPIKDFNYIELEMLYAFPKGYLGIGWEPEIKSVTAKAGITILKFNNKR